MSAIQKLHDRYISLLPRFEWFPLLLARITVGWIFAQSGWAKINAIDPVIQFFTSLNLPAPVFQAHLVAYTELIAGALILVGLATRYATIPLIITMIVAIIKVTAPDADETSDYFAASEYLYIVLMLFLIVYGAGAVSLDRWLLRWKKG